MSTLPLHPLIGSPIISSLVLPVLREKTKEGTQWAVYQKIELSARNVGALTFQSFGPEHSNKDTPPLPHWSLAYVGLLDLEAMELVAGDRRYKISVREDVRALNLKTGGEIVLDPEAPYFVARYNPRNYRISECQTVQGWAAAVARQKEREGEATNGCEIRIYLPGSKPTPVRVWPEGRDP